MLERVGGVSGLVLAGVPTVAYVIVNAIAGLDAAVVVAVAVSAGPIVFWLVRRQPPAARGVRTARRRHRRADRVLHWLGRELLPAGDLGISLAMAAAFTGVGAWRRRPLVKG